MRGDHRPVALDHAPVHAAVVVALEIPRREPVELGAADIAADRGDELVPATVRREKGRGRDVGRVLGERIEPLVEVPQRVEEGSLLRQRKPDRRRRPLPRRRRFVDRATLRHGDRVPGIAVGRMQPAAAEIECCAGRPSPSAEPRPRLDDQAVDARVGEPPARRDSGRAAADDHHLGIAAGHALFRDVESSKPTPIVAARLQPCATKRSYRLVIS